MKRAIIASAVLLLCGAPALADQTDDRFTSFRGMTMTQWSETTGIAPDSMYETGDSRVFTAHWRYCDMQLFTRYNGHGYNSDGWTIYKTIRRGICDAI